MTGINKDMNAQNGKQGDFSLQDFQFLFSINTSIVYDFKISA